MSIKLQDLAQELSLDDRGLERFMQLAGVNIAEDVKRLPDKDAARVRNIVRDTRRREAKKQETIRLPSIITVRALSEKLELPAAEIIKHLLKNGVLATLNEDLDYETAAIIASDLGYTTEEDVAQLEQDVLTPDKLAEILLKERPDEQEARPPVVTIMGHVDHGKTTLLDTIRQTKVADSEAGGITQRISSYQAKKKGKLITFIDTPGHEAFEFMRKRGASLADIAILVVAADEGVQEQTKEAIRHAKGAGVPIVVAITKIDKPGAEPDKVKRQLADLDLLPEDYGGKTPTVGVSAVRGDGIDDLLDTILLVADIEQPKAVLNRPALAIVVESRRDQGMGPLAAVLIHAGMLKVGNSVVVGNTSGTIRQILDYTGKPIKEAKPSQPVTIVGLDAVPNAGDILQVVEARTVARKKAASVRRLAPSTRTPTQKTVKVKKSEKDKKEGEPEKEEQKVLALPVVLKADVHGSLEAIKQTIQAMATPDVGIRILRAEIGNVTESDVMTASAAQGVILGFNTTVSPTAARMADADKVFIGTYPIIYELIEEVRQRLEALLPVEVLREELGKMTVLKVFFSIRGRQIVGGRVTTGIVKKRERLEAVRNGLVVARGTITELQQNRNEIETGKMGQEVGITVDVNGKIKEGDTLVIFHEETRKRLLGDVRERAAAPATDKRS